MKLDLLAFWQLLRPFNCFMAAAAVFVGYSIAIRDIVFSLQVFFGMASAFLICGAGQAINDYFDRKLDVTLHPYRPIPSKRLRPGQAFVFSLSLFLVGMFLALPQFLPPISFVIALAFSLLLTAYSAFLARKKWIGNWVVAAGTAFTLVFGASIAGHYGIVLLLAFAAFLTNVARELIKDLEDLKHDRKHKFSLPMFVPHKNVRELVLALYAIAIVIAFSAFFVFGYGNLLYLFFIALSSIVFLGSASQAFFGNYKRGKNLGKQGMVLALIGYFLGILS